VFVVKSFIRPYAITLRFVCYLFYAKCLVFLQQRQCWRRFDITAELLSATSLSVTQDIAGRILKESQTNVSKALLFTSLLVKGTLLCVRYEHSFNICRHINHMHMICLFQAPPPPPTNLSQSDVSQTSVTVDWSAPAHQEPFRITNYTAQYKKADTEMSYYDAVVVGSDQRTVDVDNLDSNTQYLLRVMSVNAYGSQPSEMIEVKTNKGEQNVHF